MLRYNKQVRRALEETIQLGFAGADFNPVDDPDAHLFEQEGAFLIYKLNPSHVKIELIHVRKEFRGKGIAGKLLSKFMHFVRRKSGWPRAVRADVLNGNEKSLGLFKNFRTRSYELETVV